MSKFLLINVFCIIGTSLSKAGVSMEEALITHRKVTEECMTEVGATSSDLDDLVNEKTTSGMQGKCLRACLLKKFGVMDSNGKMNREVILEHARVFTNNNAAKIQIVTEMLDACLSIDVPSNHCEAAEEYGRCYKVQAIAPL